MNQNKSIQGSKKMQSAGVLATLGVVMGVIGIAPLFVMNSVLSAAEGEVDRTFVLGVLSFIFWTLTVISSLKYVILALQTENKGEGGIFALYTLLKRKSGGTAMLVIVGVSALMVSSVVAPALALTASVEGAEIVRKSFPVVQIVLAVLVIFFVIQRYKPDFISSSSGPLVAIWFVVIGIAGLRQLLQNPGVISALNPLFAVRFIAQYPGSFLLLGTIFLCTAGAESIYQELGDHIKSNIRLSWILVKVILIVSYFGQGAWIIAHSSEARSFNPFFAIIPEKFIIPVILLSVLTAVAVGQALINRSFTLVSEAVSLSFWPNIKIIHPTLVKGQVYLPLINWLFWIVSSLFTIIFRNSSDMTAAYGIAVILNMIITTILLIHYYQKHEQVFGKWWIFMPVLLLIEIAFLAAILSGLDDSEFFSGLLTALFILIMIGWYFGRRIKNRYISFANLSDYTSLLTELHSDKSVPITATNLVYIIKASRPDQVESKVIYSILQRQPKRAETYWFLHIDIADEPDRFDYEFTPIVPGILHRVDFHLGFKVEPRINLYFREVLEDLVNSGEISLTSSYNSLKKFNFSGDFKYILIDRVMLRDSKLPAIENFVLALHGFTRLLDITDEKALHLDLTNTIVEKIPVTIEHPAGQRIARVH